jgi:multidrug resistance efflux pump
VAAGALVARLDAIDTELALARARAERDQADAQLRLLKAGARVEDIRQAEAQLATAQSDAGAADAEVVVAETDAARFESLLKSKAGTEKQRDEAGSLAARGAGAGARSAGSGPGRARAWPVCAGASPRKSRGAARARTASDAQIATLRRRSPMPS